MIRFKPITKDRFMKKVFSLTMVSFFSLVVFVLGYAFTAFPQDSSVVAPQDFFAHVLQAVQDMGGLATLGKISAVILLLVASMKVTFLKNLIWSKLGSWQALVAPALGLIAGILGLGNHGAAITFASVMAYFASGVGAVGLHELLDVVKAIPGLGPIWVTVISIIESIPV